MPYKPTTITIPWQLKVDLEQITDRRVVKKARGMRVWKGERGLDGVGLTRWADF